MNTATRISLALVAAAMIGCIPTPSWEGATDTSGGSTPPPGSPTPQPPPPGGDGDGDGDGVSGCPKGTLGCACLPPGYCNEGLACEDGLCAEGSGDGDGDGDGATFVPPSDGAIGPTCDPWLQDCAEGEKCVPYQSVGDTWDNLKCVPVLGDGALGDPCTYDGAVKATDDCDSDHLCWNHGANGYVCLAFCGGNANNPICPSSFSCSISAQGSIYVCLPNCDPLQQDCNDGQGCYWEGTSFVCANATQNIPLGEPCGYINDCAPGHLCAIEDVLPGCQGASCCAAWCDLENPTCVAPLTSCVPFFEEGEGSEMYDDVGLCILETP